MPDTRFRLRDTDLDWREVDREVVALDLRESRYLAINRAGQVLWATLAEGATRDDLIERLADAFGLDRSAAATDVDAFTTELDSRGLLVREPEGG